MDFGGKISVLIDLACKKKKNSVVDIDEKLTERLVEKIF